MNAEYNSKDDQGEVEDNHSQTIAVVS